MTRKWNPPAHWKRIRCIDAHAAGEPLRVIVEGFPEPPGDTILDKRRWAREHADDLRRALMWEPRGHADMYGCLPTEPVTPDGDLGVLFLHNEGFSTMCGHGIIAMVTVGLEFGLIRPADPEAIRIDTPAGRVTARAHLREGRVERVSFRNVPSFVLERDMEVDVPGLGRVRCDLAFGGAFYAVTEAAPLGLELTPERITEVIEAGRRIKAAVQAAGPIRHPEGDADLDFLYGTILTQPLYGEVHSRNVCVFADGEVDRSPTGTGVSARAAIHVARGELAIGETIAIESLIGTRFEVRALETAEVGGLPAVIPEVGGQAFVTGRQELLIDPDDPLGEGFLLR